MMRTAIFLCVVFAAVRSKPLIASDEPQEATESGAKKACDVGGTPFASGVQIEMSGSPCKVCVCQDGTVECDTIKCDWRKDCTPKYEPGLCCPTFVNCPGDNDDGTISPVNEKFLAEEQEEMSLPVVQLEHLDLISTLSVNPAASTTTIEEFTKDSATVTESSVEAPSEASSEYLHNEPDRTEEPGVEGREAFDEENSATTVASEKLREGEFFIFATTIAPSESTIDQLEGRESQDMKLEEEPTEEPPVEVLLGKGEVEDADLSQLRESTDLPSGDLKEGFTEEYLAALRTDEEPATDVPAAELRTEEEEAAVVTEFQDEQTSETTPAAEENEISLAEMKSSDDEANFFTSTTTENSFSTTTTFEGLSTTTSSFDVTTKVVPDLIIGKIMEDEPKVTELNVEVLVQDPAPESSNAEVLFVATTADPEMVESVESVSIASAEGGDAVGAEFRLEETSGGAKNSSELKIFQVLFSNEEKNNEVTTSRSADSSAMLFLPQLPRPLIPPATNEWKAAAFEETKDELMAGLWHEALDILTGGRAAAIRATARKTQNSKFIQRE